MFKKDNFKETTKNEVDITNYDFKIFSIFLAYFYTGLGCNNFIPNIKGEECIQLITLSKYFEISEFQKYFLEKFKFLITHKNNFFAEVEEESSIFKKRNKKSVLPCIIIRKKMVLLMRKIVFLMRIKIIEKLIIDDFYNEFQTDDFRKLDKEYILELIQKIVEYRRIHNPEAFKNKNKNSVHNIEAVFRLIRNL